MSGCGCGKNCMSYFNNILTEMARELNMDTIETVDMFINGDIENEYHINWKDFTPSVFERRIIDNLLLTYTGARNIKHYVLTETSNELVECDEIINLLDLADALKIYKNVAGANLEIFKDLPEIYQGVYALIKLREFDEYHPYTFANKNLYKS